MKKKDSSTPPSKKSHTSSTKSVEELALAAEQAKKDFENAQERYEKKTEPYKNAMQSAHIEYMEAKNELWRERAFQNTLDKVTKELDIPRHELEAAYADNKPSLSVKFNTRTRRKNHLRQGYPILGMSLSLTTVLSYLVTEAHPALFVFPAIFGAMSFIIGHSMASDKKYITDADKEIKAKALEYKQNKQLPSPNKP